MPTPSPDRPGRSSDELLARAGWPAVATALLRGLAHDLSGRAAALGGLVELLRLDDDGEGPPVLGLLREESTRLEEAVELVRLLAGDDEREPPEPLGLEPLVRTVLALHARHRGLEAVETILEVESDVPPVRVRRTLLVRALLLLLGAAGQAARKAGGRRVEVVLLGRDDRAVVTIAFRESAETGESGESGPEGGDAIDAEGAIPHLERAMRGAEAVLAADGAAVLRTGGEDAGGVCLELSLPALRRRD